MSVYVFSDLHGYLDLYKKIKNYVKPEDTLYCLGDCGDRGPNSWETIKIVAKDPQIKYIKGNHEDMLVKAGREILSPNDADWQCEHQRLLAYNGGMDTLDGLMQENNANGWISYLAKLPTHETYINSQNQEIFLSHAGCTFWYDNTDIPTDKDLLWNRLHYFDNYKLFAAKYIVHGHTPIEHLASEIGICSTLGALKYSNGMKYCIDAGTYYTGRTILFNLDTFESIEFKL